MDIPAAMLKADNYTNRLFSVADGMAASVFENKYSRRKEDGKFQTWPERLHEVVSGNFMLDPRLKRLANGQLKNPKDAATYFDYLTGPAYGNAEVPEVVQEYRLTRDLALKGVMPFSGRHLQHGDFNQPNKLGELFTNCSTSPFSFLKFFLLLKGSGVGRLYDDDICYVDWDYLPNVRLVLDEMHPDYENWIEPLREAKAKYDGESEKVRWFEIEDSAEGWVRAVAILETAAFHKNNRDHLFVFDFSRIRKRGAPIIGQQGRPASGPVPFILAMQQSLSVKGAGFKPWKQALYIDHYLSSCVAVGGIRRSARIAVKSWRDREVIEFIDIKRGGLLQSSNNSIAVDAEFWEQAKSTKPSKGRRVFEAAVQAAYHDGTGEPGFINVDKLTCNDNGIEDITGSTYFDQKIGKTIAQHPKTYAMMDYTLSKIKNKKYKYIVNPCSEIVLSAYGGYCIIGDLCLSEAASLDEAINAGSMMARALMRVNMMEFLFKAEVKRTNRIGVGLTGIHEFAYRHFGLTFRDMISLDLKANLDDQYSLHVHKEDKASDFWNFIAKLRKTVEESAIAFAKEVGVEIPHTMTTIKPSGTISKVMSCTEGAHLPAMSFYIRWVQFMKGDPANKDMLNREVQALVDRGYLMKDISHKYADRVVVGYPTKLSISDLMGDNVVTATEVSPTEQYAWLRLLEKYWLGGEGSNNQVSYTLKYNPKNITYDQFMAMLVENQDTVKCCAVMQQEDIDTQESEKLYGYLPEQPVSKLEFDQISSKIDKLKRESYDASMLECAGGACPIEKDQNDVASEVLLAVG
jgi:adenosylcobalamin-dependent ribonucleoside-triphosphate reductase